MTVPLTPSMVVVAVVVVVAVELLDMMKYPFL